MNKENAVKKYAERLQQIQTREELNTLFELVKKESNPDSYEAEQRIRQIKELPLEAIRGIDNEKIRFYCQAAAADLLKLNLQNSLSDEAVLVETILADFAENCFFERFLQPGTKKCQYNCDKFIGIIPGNEYDVQHLLYCLLRPCFSGCRLEVTGDDGTQAIRSDISVSQQTIIEVKSTTRTSMNLRKLTEEISADITRFRKLCLNHYFFIYDPRGLIPDCKQFADNYSQNEKNHRIRIFIYQPGLTARF